MDPTSPQRRAEDRSHQHSYELLRALSLAQARFIADADPRELFSDLLTAVLSLTHSQCGFLAEVADPSSGAGALQVYAASDVEWSELYLDTLFNAAIETGQTVIFADPPDGGKEERDARIRAFLGLPIHRGRELVGILGIANRPTGYDAVTVAFLAPVLATCGTLIVAARTDRRRQQAEQALRESEERFRAMADTAPVMVWMSGPDKGCTYLSKTWLDFTGRSLAEELGDGWAQGVHPEDHHRCLSTYEAAFDARLPFKMEYRLKRRDGEYRWVLDTGVPRYCADGIFSGYIGSCVDITERKQVEEALQRSEERYRGVVQIQTELICRFLPDSTLTFVNEAYARCFGRTVESLIGTPFLPLIPQEFHSDILRHLATFTPGQAIRTYEHPVFLPDGEQRWQEWTDHAIFDQGGRIVEFQAVGRDITDHRRTEEGLRRSEAALQQSQEELRLLAGRLLSAHEEERSWLARELHDDLSQRLAALAIETAMLEVECRSMPEATLKRLRNVKNRLVDVSTDVHNISRRLHPAILKDLGLADAIRSECVRFSEREGIQVEFVGEAIPEMPSETAICLYRIAQEGLHNIAKHAKTNKASVSLWCEGRVVVLSIQDFGVGFVSASVRSSQGLGLASMRERAWLALGDIVIRSQPGEGTVIEVRVPFGEQQS